MQSITESGITLTFPDNNYFRFETCQGYKNIQDNFKEMDVCWYDAVNNVLYIIELKQWDNVLLEEQDTNFAVEKIKEIKEGITKHRIQELFKKSLDSVSMFVSVLLNKPYSSKISACAPFSISHDTKIKVISIIDTAVSNSDYISSIHSKYKTYFKPYAKLFGISTYIVMTKAQATQEFSWVS